MDFSPMADMATELAQEKARRVYYQDLVYFVCDALDRVAGRKPGQGTVCGTAESPSWQVQEAVCRFVDELSSWRHDKPMVWTKELRSRVLDNHRALIREELKKGLDPFLANMRGLLAHSPEWLARADELERGLALAFYEGVMASTEMISGAYSVGAVCAEIAAGVGALLKVAAQAAVEKRLTEKVEEVEEKP